jgi:two-component system response regulator VicR
MMNREKCRILLADDDASLRTAIGKIVEQTGYEFCEASNGAEALEVYKAYRPDVVILDVMMPVLDGFEVCEAIRRIDNAVPVLFLSAKGDIVDKRIGYRAGADDYLVKPFGEEELLLRIGALLRRRDLARNDLSSTRETVTFNGLKVDFRRHEVSVDGRKIDLTPREARIITLMAEHPGEVFSREDLIEGVWGAEYLDSSVSIPVYIRKIREKIEKSPSEPEYLRTVWGYGYKLGEGD